MPTKVNLELIIVWACVGFFTGAGWAVATWLVGRILGLLIYKSSAHSCPLSANSEHCAFTRSPRRRERAATVGW